MAEVISEEQPRIKFSGQREGPLPDHTPSSALPLTELAEVMAELEKTGLTPILNDGLVAGNCAIAASCVSQGPFLAGGRTAGQESSPRATADIFVSRSGKTPGVMMGIEDFVLVTAFDSSSWSARYRSAKEEARPTSDTPLHAAALASDVRAAYGWAEAPLVAVHGHALAEGAGLELAQRLGFPISHEATLFSTPEDLHQLQQLFAAHPYPQHKCYIRRGHGFFLLGRDVQDVQRSFHTLILPHLVGLLQ